MGKPKVNVVVGAYKADATSIYNTLILRAGASFASQVTEKDTKYIVKWDFDLGGETVELPSNSILEFQGGSLANGTLVGNGTQIVAEKVAIFSNITIDGEWNISEITTAWFREAGITDDVLKDVFKLCSNDYYNELTIEPGDYWINVPVETNTSLPLKSNTKYILLGNIRTRGHSYPAYKYTVGISQKSNITVCGSGSIYGDRMYHDFSDTSRSHETNHVIMINLAKNVLIEGINIKDGTGDGIDIVHQADGDTDGIVIRNFTIDNCRRQGITAGGTNVVIENGRITNIKGTLPEAAIDVEITSDATHSNKRIDIRNLYIENCYQGVLVTSSSSMSGVCGLVNVENVEAYNVGRGIVSSRTTYNVSVRNCKFTIIPRKRPGIWPREFDTSQTYTLNTLQGWNSTIHGCRFTMEGEIPDWAEEEFTMLTTRYSAQTHYMSVTNNYFDCPLITACYVGYMSVFSGNTAICKKFKYDGSNSSARITDNRIEADYLAIEGGVIFNGNVVALAGPMVVGTTCVVSDNRIAFNVSEYDFGDSPKYLFLLYGRANVHHNTIAPAADTVVDTIFYHNSTAYTSWITDNKFTASFEYEEIISGAYYKKDILYNNYINKGSIENTDNSHPGSPRLSSSVTLNPNVLMFYSVSGRTAAPISSNGTTDTDKNYINLNHSLVPNVLFYTGSQVLPTGNVIALNEDDVWTKNVVVDLRYSLNFSADLTVGSPVYLVASYNSGAGTFKFTGDPAYSQALPTSADGKIYIYLGNAVSAKEVILSEENHMYAYDSGMVKLVV